mmetsp:Transcript_127973/g.368717  ORF Transcript_127973/g.368717 Transcript_127973/m.368717 type:complete len:287 (-) Transcript_127973:49-909(-)
MAEAEEGEPVQLPIIDRTQLVKLEKVGDGRTSDVFRGTYMGVEVAIKEMREFAAMKPKDRTNLAREIDILRRVKHKHLLGFVGIMENAGKIQVITDFCHGGDVFDLVHNSGLQLAWPQRMVISLDVANAMQYLHSYDPPIIHRDLKSLNLLLVSPVVSQSDEPFVKVADLGQARMVESVINMTVNAGTYHWMAPEVFCEEHYDSKVDVYSFSMVLYELICQAIPFGNLKPQMVGVAVIQGERPDLSVVPDDCPPFLREMMTSSWSAAPEDRPDFQSILDQFSAAGY